MTDVAHITSILDGVPAQAEGRGDVEIRNPADTSDLIATVQPAAASVLVDATERASAAQRSWGRTPAPIRGLAVHHLGLLLEANKETLSQIVTREIGKPIVESRGEVQEAIDTCLFFASEGRRLYGQTVPSEMPDKQLFTFRNPVGTMAVVTAGNFPVAVPSWYLVPALLAGNAVVWKPAEYTPSIAEAFTRLVLAAGFPAGVFQLVISDGASTFDGLEAALSRGLLDKVGFTGSVDVGRAIGELCGRHLVTPTLELGGKNPLVVTPDADLDLAVEGSLFSGFGTAGQRCTSLGVAIVHESVYDDFVARFAKATEISPVGDPTQDVLYGPMISQKFADNYERWLEHLQPHHTTAGSSAVGRITSSAPREGFVGNPDRGLYYHPVIVQGVTVDDLLYQQETFGPIVPVMTYTDLDDAIELSNGHGYGLSSAIYTTDPGSAFRFREGVTAGMVSVNNSTSGAEAHLPFGGNAKSGNGARQSGIWMLEQVTRWQSLNWDYSGKLQKAQMDVGGVEADLTFRL